MDALLGLRLDQTAPTSCRLVPQSKRRKKNRSGKGGVSCTLCTSYSDMLYFDFLNGDEMVVVEQPFDDVEATLPGVLQRHLYGT